MKILFSYIFIGLLSINQAIAADIEQLTQQSREAIKTLGGELKHTLQTSMKAGGPVESISSCQSEAPQISNKIFDEKGMSVARTSLNYRNPENKPDDWEKFVLEQFESRMVAGEDIQSMEYSELIVHDGDKIFRYMKAIPTAEVCLNCHGSNVSPPIAKKINSLYPGDKATGYMVGDIRGAFSVIQPVK